MNSSKQRRWTRAERRDAYRLGLAGTVEGRTNEFRPVAGSPATGFEIRGSSMFAGKGVEVIGDVCRYNDPTTIWDSFGSYREQVKPRAATHLLGSPNLRTVFLLNHSGLAMARVPTTMSFEDTSTALRFQAVLDTRMHIANDLVVAMENGVITQTSWAFTVDKGGDKWAADKSARDLTRFSAIHDVSAVNSPAYASASIGFARGTQMPCATCGGSKTCADCNGTGLAGIDGTQSGVDPSPASAMDGTGTRAKYTAAQKAAMLNKGHALANANGDPSFPVNDAEDIKHAVKAVPLGSADEDAIRLHIIKNAKRLGLMKLIPDTWSANGSLKTRSDAPYLEMQIQLMKLRRPPQERLRTRRK